MPILKIDKKYDLETLFDERKAQLAFIQFVQQEFAEIGLLVSVGFDVNRSNDICGDRINRWPNTHFFLLL